MRKETYGIPIRLVLPRYEVMMIVYALRELAGRRHEQAVDSGQSSFKKDGDEIRALANRILVTASEQFIANQAQCTKTT